jgi:putative tryptophan/tyrosine transport system substrate-binding protein
MRFFLTLLVVLALFAPAEAQQPKKVPRVGVLSTSTRSNLATRVNAFRQGMHELGYVDGRNLVIEDRYSEGKLDRLGELAAELVRLKIDVIVTLKSDTKSCGRRY